MKTIFVLPFLLALFPGSCGDPVAPVDNPIWVEKMIAEFKAAPVGNPPQSIWRYDYHDATVYYVPPQCCDQYSQLYNAEGVLLGAPDGGFTGTGDGRVTDFFSTRTNEHLVWRDTRKRE